MLLVYGHYTYFAQLQTSDSDVHRRQNLTPKVDPRDDRVNLMTLKSNNVNQGK